MHNSTYAIRIVALFAGVFSLLQSCAPPPQISTKLIPIQADSSFMDDGREFVTLQKDSVQLAAAFDRYEKEYLIFNVEITNFSTHPVEVDPERFYYRMQDSLQHIQHTDDLQVPIAVALSPQQEIYRLDNEIKREEARVRAKKVFWTIFAVAATVATVAVIADNNSKPVRNRESAYQRDNTNRVVMNAWALTMNVSSEVARSSVGNSYAKTDNLASQRETWEKYPLRSQTLQPGQRMYGDVIFKPHQGVGEMLFVFPVENQRYTIPYRQIQQTK